MHDDDNKMHVLKVLKWIKKEKKIKIKMKKEEETGEYIL